MGELSSAYELSRSSFEHRDGKNWWMMLKWPWQSTTVSALFPLVCSREIILLLTLLKSDWLKSVGELDASGTASARDPIEAI